MWVVGSHIAEWDKIEPHLRLYKYQQVSHLAEDSKPVILLHSCLANHESLGTLAQYLTQGGVRDIYAADIMAIEDGLLTFDDAIKQLREVVQVILEEHPDSSDVVMIGYGTGGMLAYNYWHVHGVRAHLAYLIMIATPHSGTVFSVLMEQSIRGSNPEQVDSYKHTSPIDFNRISMLSNRQNSVVINIMGDGAGPDFDGVVRNLHLPEAVNKEFSLRHEELHRSSEVANFILECLRGKRYQVKLKLVALQMRREDSPSFSGPVCFDIEGIRMPPDTIFEPIHERMYLFEEAIPPICTLSYPIQKHSAMITLHLRDLSQTGNRRRRLYVRLHTPLVNGSSTAHTMQDSEGSDFLWRIICEKMPTVLGSAWYDNTQPIIRGI
jgi:hypothetical protein